ncbi:MAG TPA: 4Fe-4S dicluster domain-containing protein [Candidatus Limnocylindrales bacterium]
MAIAPGAASRVVLCPLPAASPSTPLTTETPPPAWQPLAIRAEHCKGCELCIAACPHDVLELDQAIVNPLGYHPVHLIDAAGCTSCALCARVCPDAVFTVYARPKGASR